jgi:hypothetical protein
MSERRIHLNKNGEALCGEEEEEISPGEVASVIITTNPHEVTCPECASLRGPIPPPTIERVISEKKGRIPPLEAGGTTTGIEKIIPEKKVKWKNKKKKLLPAGDDILITNTDGVSPLHTALKGVEEVVTIAQKHGRVSYITYESEGYFLLHVIIPVKGENKDDQ